MDEGGVYYSVPKAAAASDADAERFMQRYYAFLFKFSVESLFVYRDQLRRNFNLNKVRRRCRPRAVGGWRPAAGGRRAGGVAVCVRAKVHRPPLTLCAARCSFTSRWNWSI